MKRVSLCLSFTVCIVVSMITGCRPAHYSTKNLATYQVKDGKLSDKFSNEKLSADDYAVLILQKVCVSKFPDAFGQGSSVIAGAEIDGFQFYDEKLASWEPKTVKQTIDSIGVYREGCINFSQFILGEFRYKDNPIKIRLTLKKLANEKEKKYAETMLLTGKTALGTAGGPVAVAAMPVANLLYAAVVDRNLEEAEVLDFKVDFAKVSMSGDMPLVPRRGQTVIMGEVTKDGWASIWGSTKRPTVQEFELLNAKPDGELLKEAVQYTDAFYATLAIQRLYRNPVTLRKLGTLQDLLVDRSLSPVATSADALAKANNYINFYDDAVSKNDFSPTEVLYLSTVNTCITSWRDAFWSPGIIPSKLATASSEERKKGLAALSTITSNCEPFYKQTDSYAGSKVTEENIKNLCDQSNNTSMFNPTCSEYRLRLASSDLANATKATIDAVENKETLIVELKAQASALESTLEKKSVEVDAVYESLKESGIDVNNIKQGLDEYRKTIAVAKAVDNRLAVLKEKISKLGVSGPAVVIRKNRIMVNLPGEVLFDSGSYTLNYTGEDVLRKIAKAIEDSPSLMSRTLQIAGHTDNTPVSAGAAVLDNWHLSMMRARSVVMFLIRPREEGGGGLAPSQLSAAGYGDLDPLNDNLTEENKAKNRRVEIVLVPDAQELLGIKQLLEE
ncbi:MAG: hypothetical protein A2X80_11105 [Geobacteraceae bacterium GWB2_52_12]|nr:MAG: hypothetical protein A2X80_11105 [Geobacteraceae bacterium GWB2_52_12]